MGLRISESSYEHLSLNIKVKDKAQRYLCLSGKIRIFVFMPFHAQLHHLFKPDTKLKFTKANVLITFTRKSVDLHSGNKNTNN